MPKRPDQDADASGAEEERRLQRVAIADEFKRLYFNWLAARAALADPDRPGDDASDSEAQDRCDAAGRALLVVPAVMPWMIWQKWEVLDEWMSGENGLPDWADNRITMALGVIKADIMSVGLQEPG